jgi:hypothetical protein
MSFSSSPSSDAQIGSLWLASSKIARKAFHVQTAYSAILQAAQLDTPMTFLQSAKLLKASDQTQRALQVMDNALVGLLPDPLAKARAQIGEGRVISLEDRALAKVRRLFVFRLSRNNSCH